MKILYNPSAFGKIVFRKTIWETKNNKILLTFDDGVNPVTTPKVLKILDELNLNALFFLVGENVAKYPTLVEEVLSGGHEIGNHTFNHKVLTKLSPDEIKAQVKKTNAAISELTNREVKFFRPPKGRLNFKVEKIITDFGMQNVMWNLLTYDYKNDLNIVKFALRNFLNRNSIVVLHDNVKNKEIIEDSIRFAFEFAAENKFFFGEPIECLK